ncbi:MAG: sulfatase [Lentisphaeraceae bacterium]|nr:sulfatase [Lentisphaeraceae bacterium]
MRKVLYSVLLLSCFFAVLAEDKRPNIVFIFSDDHAYQAISAYGSKINQTPNIDRIAAEGMIFNKCYVTNSICGPSRAVIQTGKHSHLNGFYRNGLTFNGDQQTFPKLLQKAGYQTAIIGKWHLKSVPQGYDYSEVLIGQGPYYNPKMMKNGKKTSHVGYTSDIIADLTVKWLKEGRSSDKPFMLMMQHKAPHRNWMPGPKYINKYDDKTIPEPDNLFDDYSTRGTAAKTQDMSIEKTMNQSDLKLSKPRGLNEEQLKVWNAAYGEKNAKFKEANLQGKELIKWKYQRYIKDYIRCIDSVDDAVGRVMDYLKEAGLEENTIVIYSSDQGFYLGEHGWFDKRFMYEESFRTPLLVKWPGKVKPGTVNNKDIVSNLDFAQTFLDIAGAPQPSDMQGLSLKPVFEGNTPDNWRKSFYYHYYEFPAVHSVRKHNGVSTGRYKLINFYNENEQEFYDLKNDPQEMNNLINNPEYAKLIAEHRKELSKLKEQYQVPADDEVFKKFSRASKKKK